MKNLLFALKNIFFLLFFTVSFGQNFKVETISLSNDLAKVKISTFGAELQSFFDIKNDRELIWQGDETYWAQQSPVLFPFIGKRWQDQIVYNKIPYPMKTHGFASRKAFEIVRKTSSEVWLRLIQDEETKKTYPFDYDFQIGFILNDKTLRIQWKITNNGLNDLYFQVGGHTGYNLPDWKETDAVHGFVKLIPGKKDASYIVKDAGKFYTENPVQRTVETDQDLMFPITKDFFKNDAVVFENYEANEIQVFDKEKKPIVFVKTETPIFALWTAKQNSPFLCIEPWWGRAATENLVTDVSKEKWVQKLPSKQVFNSSYTIVLPK